MAQSEPRTRTKTESTDIPGDAETEVVDGGELVYVPVTEYSPILGHETTLGQRYVGFVNVTDWNAIERELRARGLDAGDVLHLPEFDA